MAFHEIRISFFVIVWTLCAQTLNLATCYIKWSFLKTCGYHHFSEENDSCIAHIQTLSSWASKNAVAGTCVEVLIDEIDDHSSCSIKSRTSQILQNTNGHHNARFSLYKIDEQKIVTRWASQKNNWIQDTLSIKWVPNLNRLCHRKNQIKISP